MEGWVRSRSSQGEEAANTNAQACSGSQFKLIVAGTSLLGQQQLLRSRLKSVVVVSCRMSLEQQVISPPGQSPWSEVRGAEHGNDQKLHLHANMITKP